MKLLDFDSFQDISEKIPKVEDYFDFPSSLIAFGESLGSSSLYCIPRNIFFRKRNNQLTLITYFCSSEELWEIIQAYKHHGFKIKSLNFVNKDMRHVPTKFYMNEYWVDQEYSFEKHVAGLDRKKRYNILRDIKLSYNKYDNFTFESKPFTHHDALDLFTEWVSFAATRHFMVMKGHYLKYIERYFQNKNNVQFLGFWRKSDGLLFGMAGFEIFKDNAQLTIMKHRGGDYSFSRFFWTQTIYYILLLGVTKIFCGSTADSLKEALGFQKERSFKIIC